MSWLSKITGVHISPKGVHVEPLKALGTALTIGSLGGLGPVGAALGSIPGAGAISKVGGVLSHIPGVGALESGIDKLGGLKGAVSKVGSFLGDHGDQLLGAGSLYEGYNNSKKSTDLMNQALDTAKQSYAERAPLRTAGISGMMNETRPDLSSIYVNPSNPYSKVRPRAA